jgi:hypothetical protein
MDRRQSCGTRERYVPVFVVICVDDLTDLHLKLDFPIKRLTVDLQGLPSLDGMTTQGLKICCGCGAMRCRPTRQLYKAESAVNRTDLC